jgi:hypothetical protein
MILNDKMTSDVHDTVAVKCHVCSIPEIIQINWLRHDQIMMDVNIIIKTQTIDHYQCSESIMEIVVCLTNFYFEEISSFGLIRISVNINLKNMNVEQKII